MLFLKEKCSGLITRRRETRNSVEESIIDHAIITEDLESVRADEERQNVLEKIVKMNYPDDRHQCIQNASQEKDQSCGLQILKRTSSQPLKSERHTV